MTSAFNFINNIFCLTAYNIKKHNCIYVARICRNSFDRKLHSQTVIREMMLKTLSYQEAAHKILVKFTPLLLTKS